MRLCVLAFLCITKFSCYSFSQSAQVNNFDQSEFKGIAGFHSMIFHQSSYLQNDENVRVFLVKGKYYLFPAKDLSFGDNIEVKSVPSQIELVKKQNHYEFELKDEGTYDFNISAVGVTAKSKELLYVIYKAYDPYKSKTIAPFSYKSLDGELITSDKTEQQYSVLYFVGRKDFIDPNHIERLNDLKSELTHVQLVCLFKESRNELQSFQKETNFNWNFIPSVTNRELIKYQIGELISEPAVYVVDNEQNTIVYYYYGIYNLPAALKTALKELESKD